MPALSLSNAVGDSTKTVSMPAVPVANEHICDNTSKRLQRPHFVRYQYRVRWMPPGIISMLRAIAITQCVSGGSIQDLLLSPPSLQLTAGLPTITT
jgi:hypothetical protein